MGIGVTTPGKKLYYKAHLKWITKYLKKKTGELLGISIISYIVSTFIILNSI